MNQNKRKISKIKSIAKKRRNLARDEYEELLKSFPSDDLIKDSLDRLKLMRLVNSYIKTRHFLNDYLEINNQENLNNIIKFDEENNINFLKNQLKSFLLIMNNEGICLYVSSNIEKFIGLRADSIIGKNIYSLIYPGDHGELSELLGGIIPSYECEIFDKIDVINNIISNSVIKKTFQYPCKRSVILRWKCSIANKGKVAKLKSLEYKPLKFNGNIRHLTKSNGTDYSIFISTGSNFINKEDRIPRLLSNNFITRSDFDNHLLHTSECLLNNFGYETEEWVDKSMLIFIHGRDIFTFIECYRRALEKSDSESKPYRFLLKNKSWIWIISKCFLVFDKDGKSNHILGIHEILSNPEKIEGIS